jgi:hypothetical protein
MFGVDAQRYSAGFIGANRKNAMASMKRGNPMRKNRQAAPVGIVLQAVAYLSMRAAKTKMIHSNDLGVKVWSRWASNCTVRAGVCFRDQQAAECAS